MEGFCLWRLLFCPSMSTNFRHTRPRAGATPFNTTIFNKVVLMRLEREFGPNST